MYREAQRFEKEAAEAVKAHSWPWEETGVSFPSSSLNYRDALQGCCIARLQREVSGRRLQGEKSPSQTKQSPRGITLLPAHPASFRWRWEGSKSINQTIKTQSTQDPTSRKVLNTRQEFVQQMCVGTKEPVV